MTESDMRIIDQIADKLGLSRSELIRQAIVEFSNVKGIGTEPSSPNGTPPGALQWIMAKSHGPLGDFRMPVFSLLLVEHGLAGKITDDQLSVIMKRYKEHVTYWSTDDSVVRKELYDFATRSKIPQSRVWEAFYAT